MCKGVYKPFDYQNKTKRKMKMEKKENGLRDWGRQNKKKEKKKEEVMGIVLCKCILTSFSLAV